MNFISEKFEKLPEAKVAERYLEAINGYSSEKMYFVIDSLKEKVLPEVDPKHSNLNSASINILEIGPGGGAPLERLKEYIEINSISNVRVFSLEYLTTESLKQIPSKTLESLKKPYLVGGRAQEIPFRNESISAVNLSAVLHEVNSYTEFQGKFGSIHQTIKEISRILAEGGILAYRDIFAPLEDLDTFKEDVYSIPSWIVFIKYFLPCLISKCKDISMYQEGLGKIKLYQDNKEISYQQINLRPLKIDAPLGILREIQRHYLTFRDFLLKNIGQEIKIIQEEWKDKKQGIKNLTIAVNPNNRFLIEKIKNGEYLFKEITENIYRVEDSMEFDNLIDDFILFQFQAMENGENLRFKKILEEWLKREGGESYIYYNIPEMILNTARISLKESEGKFVLMPKSIKDIEIVSRDYYQRYLNLKLRNPLFEGKQLIRFWKLSKKESKEALNSLIQSIGKSEDKFFKIIKAKLEDLPKLF